MIKRFYEREGSEVIRENLTLEEAKEHCNDPETNSKTCEQPENLQRTRARGPWFDGFTKE